jgi:predicted HicB family RNase H-like nuclease
MNAFQYKGYTGAFDFEPDDDAFHGEVGGVRDVAHFSGRSVDELRQAFREAVDDYLAACAGIGKKPDKPYSGRFMVRLTPEAHRLADAAAKASGKSLNAYAAEVLEHAAKKTLRG